eukprot:TRINITY_DN2177_c0_g1_i1.p1 TRINITY_DN2177_c0_g1~~TRINITY_DN2177_c0_g1_i1.p1  ORF type:complete len:162 (-),score=21.39 TRINITY_DN2177_c0_g1_i1:30-494(-)
MMLVSYSSKSILSGRNSVFRFAVTKRVTPLAARQTQTQTLRKYATEARAPLIGDHRLQMATSVALASSIPIAYFCPQIADWILVFALPAHIRVGMGHIIADYTTWNYHLVGLICAVIVFLGLFMMTWKEKVGFASLLIKLWSREEDAKAKTLTH